MAQIEYILPCAVALCAVVMAFMRRMPSTVVAFSAMMGAWAWGWALFTPGTLWFWGIATAIVTANLYLTNIPPVPALRYFTAGGALTGCVVGALLGSQPGLIVGGFFGAILGFIAFRRTPAGRMNATPAQTLSIMADAAIPADTTFIIVIITLANLPLFRSL